MTLDEVLTEVFGVILGFVVVCYLVLIMFALKISFKRV